MKINSKHEIEIDKLAHTLTEAFYQDPMYYYIFPDRTLNYRYLSFFWKAILGYTVKLGTLLTSNNTTGALCLLPPGYTEFRFTYLLQSGFNIPRAVLRFPADKRRSMMDILTTLGRYQRQLLAEPHWYLMALGVKPEAQGNGIGKSLLNEMMEITKIDAKPIYLETETEKNVMIYKKFGFEVVKEVEINKYDLKYYLMIRRTQNSSLKPAFYASNR